MNGKDIKKATYPVIEIYSIGNGQFQARTKFPPNQTASIMINLAMVFVRQDEKAKLMAMNNNKVINPITGLPAIETN